jgi:ribosomal protein S18 acetylase RimI-like enzyme
MGICIELSKDAMIIAKLNEPVQELHYKRYPEYFKPYSFDETYDYFSKQIQEDNWYCYLVSEERNPIGYALFYIREYKENPFRRSYKSINIDQISINNEYRNKGIGKEIMSKIEVFAKEHSASQIELTYWEKNSEAKIFYEKQGFFTNTEFAIKKIIY